MSYSRTNPRFCHNCRLAQSQCVCEFFRIFDFPIKIWLWQDPKEKKRKNNTGFWLNNFLRNLEYSEDSDRLPPKWVEYFSSRQSSTAVLFPTDNALELITDYCTRTSSTNHLNVGESLSLITDLVVLDSTWDKAQLLYNNEEILPKIRSLKIIGGKGLFQARKAPFQGAMSTIECVAEFFVLWKNHSNSGFEEAEVFKLKAISLLQFRDKIWSEYLNNSK